MTGRSADKVLGDLLDACAAAQDLVGVAAAPRMTRTSFRLAAEAIVGRIGDGAAKLRDLFGADLPDAVPWDDVIGNRIVVDHAYDRVDYDALWVTLERDVPELEATMRQWRPPK